MLVLGPGPCLKDPTGSAQLRAEAQGVECRALLLLLAVQVPQPYPGKELCEVQRDLHEEAQRGMLPWRSRRLTQASEDMASGALIPLSVGQVWGVEGS